jgi:signal transduction histidine kinase
LLGATESVVRRLPHRGEVSIDVHGEPIVVRGDQGWVHQIVTNLVAKADRHATSRILVTTIRSGAYGRLSVADDGAGFPPALLHRAFDRFARGDSARSRSQGGAGIGLAIVASLTHAVGGTVTASNGPPLGGACVEVELLVAAP